MLQERTKVVSAVLSLAGVLAVALIDFASGVELRVFPLYYCPIAFASWHHRRLGAWLTAVASALAWYLSNYMAGARYSHGGIWAINTSMQLASFLLVGLLIGFLRQQVDAERAMARTDALTGLLTPLAFYEVAASELARAKRYRRPFALAFVDLDNFKLVNDTWGHLEGDNLLREVADSLRRSLRTTDTAARLGGDEFALLIPEAGPADAGAVIERVRTQVLSRMREINRPVTLSVGLVSASESTRDMEELVKAADALMYEAKRRGKNQVAT